MGLFGKKNKDKPEGDFKSGMVERVDTNREELQDLLKEFKEMRAGIKQPEAEETEEILDDSEGEEYELPEEDGESIENFLNGKDDIDDEPIEEGVLDEEPIEEELIDEEPIVEDEVIEDDSMDEVELEEPIGEEEVPEDEEVLDESTEEEVVDEELVENELPEEELLEDESTLEAEEEVFDEPEEIVEEEPFEELVEPIEDEVVDEIEETPLNEEEAVQEENLQEEPVQELANNTQVDGVSAEELGQKFNDFEKRLLDKIMQQFMAMQSAGAVVKEQPKAVEPTPVQVAEDDELQISNQNGHLVINGYTFTGEVVMFTPLESLKKATWEEVVRRKGHCTYHLTTSGNGGWFIKKSNAPNPYAYIENKEDAEVLAKIYAQREKAELKIHNAKGVIEKSLSFGREKLRG